MEKEKRKLPLIPYKEIGKFCGSLAPTLYSIEHHHYMALATGRSYKILTLPDLKTKFLGPTLESEVTAIQAFNEFLYVATGSCILKFHFLHLINRYEFESDVQTFQLFGEVAIVLMKENNKVALRNFVTGRSMSSLITSFVPKLMLHPLTYLNKILLAGEGQLALYNLNSGNMLFSFADHPPTAALLQKGSIELLENTPAVDIVAVGLSSGHIGIVNLKSGSVIKLFQHSEGITGLSFSTDITRDGLMAVTDKTGRISLYSLEKQELLSSLFHGVSVDFVRYLNFADKDMFITGSESDNSIKLWNRQDPEDIKYYVLRTRAGAVAPLKGIKFYDEEGFHLLGFSLKENSEIVDFSILREDMTTHISAKQTKKNQLHLATERDANIGEVIDLASSTNRARDWPNMITANKKNLKPCFWDVEDKTIVKMSASLFDTGRAKKENFIEDLGRKKRLISKVTITNCGNFGVAGFTDGYMVKVSMQSGTHVKTFFNKQVHQEKEIKGILVDSLNHFMISADESTVALWDFYSGLFQRKFEMGETRIEKLVPDANSIVFGVVSDQSQINLVEFHSLKSIRTFTLTKGTITDCVVLFSERKLVLSTTEKELSVFDIFTEKCISKYKLQKSISCMAVDKQLNYLAATFEGDRHIMLWHINKLSLFLAKPVKVRFVSFLNFIGEDKRQHYFGDQEENDEEIELQDVDEELYRELEETLENALGASSSCTERGKLVQFTEIPQNKWMPLNFIEEIEKRNRPEKNQKVEVPFFLDFDNPLNRLKQEMESEVMKKDTVVVSKLIKNTKKNKNLEEVNEDASEMLKNISIDDLFSKENKKAFKQIFSSIKDMPASQINYFIKSSIFEDPQNTTRLLGMFLVLFKTPVDFDFKTVVLKTFLENAYDRIGTNEEDSSIYEKIQSLHKSYAEEIDDSYTFLSCLLEKFSDITK